MSFSVKSLLGVLIVILFFNGSALAVEREILSVQKLKEPKREKTIDFKSAVSNRNLLNLERKTPFSLPYLAKGSIAPRTIKILAIRVQFKKEIPDDPATTGNGWFDLRSYEQFYLEEEHIIDPTPHNRQYFETHIQALGNYWNIVSRGKIQLEFDVYPKGDTAYTLPYTMSHYGSIDSTPNPQFYPVEQLDSLFKHSFKLADTSSLDQIDFSEYDSYFLFHAGSDQQHDLGEIGIDPTPSDLFTGFIMLGEPVVVKEANIWEGLILPETASQDNKITALNSLIAHEFGHQLGLVDLYNTRNFFTQVGDFALMDNFAQNVGVELDSCFTLVTGVLPVYPCGWSKAFLGFVEPVEIDNQQNINLLASELLEEDAIQLIKVPISSEEYFLIENRQIDLDGIDIPYLQADPQTGVVLGLVETGLSSEREYDYLMPGSGILIYRIDEGVAYLDVDTDGVPNFWDNKLQWDKDRKFMTLVEADGIIDFGGNYYTGFGDAEDMFYQGNQTEFTPYTYPSTRSYNKAFTHIWITDIGESGQEMSLNIESDWHQSGWPQKIIPHQNIRSLTYADVEDDGSIEIFGAADRFVYAWRSNGESLIPNPNYAFDIELNGDTTFYPLAFFDILDTTLVGTPTLGDVDGDDTLEIVSATVDGKVYCWEPVDLNYDSLADIKAGFPIDLGDSITMVPVISDFDIQNPGLEIYVGTGKGDLLLISEDGNIIDSLDLGERIVGLATTDSGKINFVTTDIPTPFQHIKKVWRTDSKTSVDITSLYYGYPPIVGDLNRDDFLDVVVARAGGTIYAWDKELSLLQGFPLRVGDWVSSQPALGDIDGDGYLEIVVASISKLYVYNYNGTMADNFPVIVDRLNTHDWIKSSPILVDVDDDGISDIVVGTQQNKIYAFNKDGNQIFGFPISCAGSISSSAVMVDLDQDLKSELLVPADDGFVYAWKLPWDFHPDQNPWPMQGHDPSHTNYFPIDDLPDLPKFAFLPEKKVYSYPNPAKEKAIIRYFLGEDAEVNIKIYDLAGDLVEKLDHTGVGGENNEKEWDCSKAASGVYLCRVEAKSSSQEEVVFCKIAVIK
jgi:M6 family metalloprotease-like protein